MLSVDYRFLDHVDHDVKTSPAPIRKTFGNKLYFYVVVPPLTPYIDLQYKCVAVITNVITGINVIIQSGVSFTLSFYI